MKKPGTRSVLGRGLSSLISSTPVAVLGNTAIRSEPHLAVIANEPTVPNQDKIVGNQGIRHLAVDKLQPSPFQPRRDFGDLELKELADSIRSLGVLQPILVRAIKHSDTFEIVAGERRWRAAKLAQLQQVPVIIREFDDREALKIALVENVQRENLNPVEEARGYERLMTEFNLSQQEVSDTVGKERSGVANLLRVLKLPAEVLKQLEGGELSLGHAKVLLTVREPAAQISLARKAIKDDMSVRVLEGVVARVIVLDSGKRVLGMRPRPDSGNLQNKFPEVTDRLRSSLGTKVLIRHQKSGRGRIEIEYFSEQELDRLIERICGSA